MLGHPLAATIGDSARCMQNLEKVLFTGPKNLRHGDVYLRFRVNPNRKIFEARKRETAALGTGEKLVLGHPLAATIGDSARCMQNLEKVLFTGPKTSDTVTFICELGLTLNRKIFEARKRETAALGTGEKLVLGHPLAATIGDSARCMQNLEKVLFTGPKTSDTVTFICD